jgi:hypothetical protein
MIQRNHISVHIFVNIIVSVHILLLVKSITLIQNGYHIGKFMKGKVKLQQLKLVEQWRVNLHVRLFLLETCRRFPLYTLFCPPFTISHALACLYILLACLSGGQRKLLLFELIYQRTAKLNDLLCVLDEPFAGVTDDFVPWIVDRLKEMRKRYNILLVTNDHVDTLKRLADNIIVSAIDRSNVQVNRMNNVDRDKCILALSVGDDYAYKGSEIDDMKFFLDVEVLTNQGLIWWQCITFLFLPCFL